MRLRQRQLQHGHGEQAERSFPRLNPLQPASCLSCPSIFPAAHPTPECLFCPSKIPTYTHSFTCTPSAPPLMLPISICSSITRLPSLPRHAGYDSSLFPSSSSPASVTIRSRTHPTPTNTGIIVLMPTIRTRKQTRKLGWWAAVAVLKARR